MFGSIIERWLRVEDGHRERALEMFGRLSPGDQTKVVQAAPRYIDQCKVEADRRGRSLSEHRKYTKSLPNWLAERQWLGTSVAISTEGKVSLPRHDALFEACARIEDKPAALDAKSWQFKRETIEQARRELVTAAGRGWS